MGSGAPAAFLTTLGPSIFHVYQYFDVLSTSVVGIPWNHFPVLRITNRAISARLGDPSILKNVGRGTPSSLNVGPIVSPHNIVQRNQCPEQTHMKNLVQFSSSTTLSLFQT